jgi:hypothetical protein
MSPTDNSSQRAADVDAGSLNCVVVLGPPGAPADAIDRIVPGAVESGRHVRCAPGMAVAVNSSAHPITHHRGEDLDVVLLGNMVSECVPGREALDWALAAVLEGRDDDLKRLQGAFVLLVLDWRTQTVTVVSDLLGIQPFYVARREGMTVLSDRAEAVCRLGGVGLDRLGFAAWMHFSVPLCDRTLFESVSRVPSASVTVCGDPVEPRPRRYWTPTVAEEPIGPDELADEVCQAFAGSVRRLLEPHDAATFFLSGGFDSRFCLLTALRHADCELDAITIPYNQGEGWVAEEVARLTGVACQRIEIRGSIWDQYDDRSLWYIHPDGFPVTRQMTFLGVTRAGRAGPFVGGSHGDSVIVSSRGGDPSSPAPADESAARELVWRIQAKQRPGLYLRPAAAGRLERLAREAAGEHSDRIGWHSKFLVRWDMCGDDRRFVPVNYLQYAHLATSLQPFSDRRMIERRLRHPNRLFTKEFYRGILRNRFGEAGALPHASELAAAGDTVHAFSRSLWRSIPAAVRFVRRHRGVMKRRWLLARLGSYGVGWRRHLHVALWLARLMRLEEELGRLGVTMDIEELLS